MGHGIKSLSLVHSDALPCQKSNQGFVALRFLARCSTNELRQIETAITFPGARVRNYDGRRVGTYLVVRASAL